MTAGGSHKCLQKRDLLTCHPSWLVFAKPSVSLAIQFAQGEIMTTLSASQPIQRIAISAANAAVMCGMSRSQWYVLNSTDRCPRPVRVGGKTLWLINELIAWMEAGAPTREKWEQFKQERKVRS
ncbi:MAG: AlpA family phage regulatory protein [Phycisphaeraceae bacterium]